MLICNLFVVELALTNRKNMLDVVNGNLKVGSTNL